MNHYLQILIVQVGFFAIIGWTILVCARDALRRGKSHILVSLLILISFPLGLLYGSSFDQNRRMAEARASVLGIAASSKEEITSLMLDVVLVVRHILP